MTDIYLIRHGETTGNRANLFVGHLDVPLTDIGLKQAEATGEYMKSVKLDAVYASDLSRAVNTAEFTAKAQGLSVIKAEKLRELSVGKWEGLQYSDIAENFPEEFAKWFNGDIDARPGGSENIRELDERVMGFIEEVAKKHDGKSIALVTHATPVRIVVCAAKGLPLEKHNTVGWASNASVTHVRYDNGNLELVMEGYDGHLVGMQTRIADGI